MEDTSLRSRFRLTNRAYWLLSILCLLLTGYICMGYWGSNGFFIYDDHPKRILYLWNFIRQGELNLWAWNPWVNAGEASLALYPPMDALLGAFIDLVTLRMLPLEEVYRLILIIVYYLPGIAALLLCRQIGISRIASLITAVIVMLYQGNYMGSDVEGSIKIGMLCGRLAISFVILSCYFTIRYLEGHGKIVINTIGAACAFSGIILSHPCHFYSAIISILIFWYLLCSEKGKGFLWMLLVGGLSFGLCAFWLIPALCYQKFMVLSLMKDFTPGDMLSLIFQMQPFFILYLIGLLLGITNGWKTKKMLAMMLLPLGGIIALWFDCVVLCNLAGIKMFDPWRVSDSFRFFLLFTTGITLDYLSLNTGMLKKKKQGLAIGLILCLGCILLKPYVNLPSNSAFIPESPAHYKVCEEIYEIDQLWKHLKDAPKGRILFTSSSIYYHPMFFYSPWKLWHTHFFGLTPLFTQREIVGGTAGMVSPVACYLYYGGKQSSLTNWVESFDDHTLFGMDYKIDINEKRLFNICKGLDITTIVVGEYEPNAVAFFLQAKEYFYLRDKIGGFYLFEIKGYKATYLDFVPTRVEARMVEYAPQKEIKIHVLRADRNTDITLKVSYFPWWEAYSQGKRLKIEPNRMGLIKCRLPEGRDYTVVFRYNIPLIITVSLFLTIITLFGLVIVLLAQNRQGAFHSLRKANNVVETEGNKQSDNDPEWDSFWKKRSQKPLGRLISWFRKQFVTTALARYILANTEKSILIEAGCGSGEITLQVAQQRGDKVILVDKSPKALALARHKAEECQVEAELIECDITELNSYVNYSPENIVYNIGVIEHFEDCSTILQEMARVSGRYAIAVIPEKSIFWKIFILLSRWMRLIPEDFLVYLYDKDTLKALIEAIGMQIHWFRGIRIFGIIPYLGVCFGVKRSDGTTISTIVVPKPVLLQTES